MTDRNEIWHNGLFEIEVNVAGRIECQGREWEVATAFVRGATAFVFARGTRPIMRPDYWLVFRDTARPQDFFFLAEHSEECVLPQLKIAKELVALPEWREMLEAALERGAWGWALWFEESVFSRSDKKLRTSSSPENGDWCLFLLPDQQGYWGEDFPYPFRCEEDAPRGENVTTQDWLVWVRGALLRETDCRTALRFARLNDKSKVSFALSWQRGSVAEFERVCRWMGQVAVSWEGELENYNLSITVRLNKPNSIFARSGAPTFSWDLPDLSVAKSLWELARKVSGAEVKATLRARQSVVAWFEEGLPRVNVTIEPPNAHERMEALINLRKWAQEMGVEGELMRIVGGSSA